MSNTFTYAGFEIDFSKLPEASINALLRRGATHFLGNEQASKVTSWVKKQETPPSDEAIAATRVAYVEGAIKALTDGTVGVRVAREGGSSAKLDPVGSMVRKLAKATVVKLMKDAKLSFNKETKTVKLADGEFDMAGLIDRQVAKGGEALVAEAKKAIEADARRNAKVAEAAGGL